MICRIRYTVIVTDIKAGMLKMVNVMCYHGIIFTNQAKLLLIFPTHDFKFIYTWLLLLDFRSFYYFFSFRLPPHPFITILNNRPESWPQLVQEIYGLCHHDNNRCDLLFVSISSSIWHRSSGHLKWLALNSTYKASRFIFTNSMKKALPQL